MEIVSEYYRFQGMVRPHGHPLFNHQLKNAVINNLGFNFFKEQLSVLMPEETIIGAYDGGKPSKRGFHLKRVVYLKTESDFIKEMESNYSLNVDQTNIRVFNGEIQTLKELQYQKDVAAVTSDEIMIEIFRHGAIKKLHEEMDILCKQHNIQAPRQIFQRFLFERKLQEELLNIATDAILPAFGEKSVELYEGLYKECKRRAISNDKSQFICKNICDKLGEKSRELQNDIKKKLVSARAELDVRFLKDQVSFTVGQVTHLLYKTHYYKFKKLFAIHTAKIEEVNDRYQFNSFYTDLFHKRLFILIQRYYCLGESEGNNSGAGFHGALTDTVFRGLNVIGVNMECFASPFNCHFNTFCSVFYDSDKYFGSVGSFFKFTPVEGSFEWNPPFLEYLMNSGVIRLKELLSTSDRPLSFFIALPNWVSPPTPSIEMLIGPEFSPYLVADEIHKKGESVWLEGFQHSGQQKYIPGSWEGRFFIVQNEAGKKKWPVNQEITKKILDSYKNTGFNLKK